MSAAWCWGGPGLVVLILPAEARDDGDDGDTELSPACAVSCWCRTAGLAGAERVSSPAPAPAPAHPAVSAVLLLLLLVCGMLLWMLWLSALQCGAMLSYLYPISPPSKY